MAVGDAYVFPGFLTPVLTQLFLQKPVDETENISKVRTEAEELVCGREKMILIDCMVLDAIFNNIAVIPRRPCTFPGVLLTSTPHNILSKPLGAFPRDHCRNNGQW